MKSKEHTTKIFNKNNFKEWKNFSRDFWIKEKLFLDLHDRRWHVRIVGISFENQKLSFQKSEEKYKEGLMDAYTFFVVRNGWLQANYNLINSKNDVVQQTELLKVFEAGF